MCEELSLPGQAEVCNERHCRSGRQGPAELRVLSAPHGFQALSKSSRSCLLHVRFRTLLVWCSHRVGTSNPSGDVPSLETKLFIKC